MSRPPSSESFIAEWRSVHFRINWKANWLNTGMAHIEIICLAKGARLPVTETGYRSHFTPPAAVANRGGPVAYVMAWLDAEAASPEWQKHAAASRQLDLF